MTKKKAKGPDFIFVMMPYLLAHLYLPYTLAWRIPYTALGIALVGWTIYGFVSEDKEKAAQRKGELAKQKTLELEKELGFEPINFHELTDDEVERMHAEMKKKKETEG